MTLKFFKSLFDRKQPKIEEPIDSISSEDIYRLKIGDIVKDRYQIENLLSYSSYLAADLSKDKQSVFIKHIVFPSDNTEAIQAAGSFLRSIDL